MFIITPQAGKALTGDAMIGEYFRTFLSYGVVTIALIMHAYERQRQARNNRQNSIANAKREKETGKNIA